MSISGWLGAVLTSFFWAISAICAQRAARSLGSLRANLFRLGLAVSVLGGITAVAYRHSFALEPSRLLVLSGVVGFGIGDVALYLALARIGSRLTVLIAFCVSPVLAAVGEWLWLGQTLPLAHVLAGLVILAGVGLTIRPSSPAAERYGDVPFGLAMALVGAAGQGWGAVLTRAANAEATRLGQSVPALSQAFHRVAGGAAFAILVYLVLAAIGRKPAAPADRAGIRHVGWWVAGAALGGPIIGVAFYQWALQNAPSAMVLAVVSLTPIFVMPLAWRLERDRPTPLQLVGAAVSTVAVLAMTVFLSPTRNG